MKANLVAALMVVVALLLPLGGYSQDLHAVDETHLQADRLLGQGQFCAAAERYRAIVGERPELFRNYASARASCLATERSDADNQTQ